METVIGVDDTDSRSGGMCTTYVGVRVAEALAAAGYAVGAHRLLRLNPAVEHKTRGNAAVAIETDAPPPAARDVAADVVASLAVDEDPRTNPGIAAVEAARGRDLADLTWRTIREIVPRSDARERLAAVGARTWTAGDGRGIVGAAAALGAAPAVEEWTAELIAYREADRRGTPRDVDADSVIRAAEATYPLTWDTADLTAGEIVCAPHTPGPVLFGIRGDTPAAVTEAAAAIEAEPVERRALFLTNQGTDAHIVPGQPGSVRDGRSYAVAGRVSEAPATGDGGHVHLAVGDGSGTLPCVAFEPTKRFRRHVRRLAVGDRIVACGEVGRGTLKLEKFALRSARSYRRTVPTCPSCGRRMDSAGRGQGYRCRECATDAPGRRVEPAGRALEPGWYEVPPVARRHLARPLVRGGLPGPVHPER